jgi:hypothetical protein
MKLETESTTRGKDNSGEWRTEAEKRIADLICGLRPLITPTYFVLLMMAQKL